MVDESVGRRDGHVDRDRHRGFRRDSDDHGVERRPDGDRDNGGPATGRQPPGDHAGDASVEVGRAFRLSATAYDSRGNLLPRASVEWASSDTRIATVDNSGRVLGVSRGSAIITARSGGKTASASVRVKRG
ncbi:MAG TPA: Ig-like domain-containing protein [Gemmatimonadaceae bacterium]|nr:Ig-like domain-containing protein [Gemmatimonadaceae bacterium]